MNSRKFPRSLMEAFPRDHWRDVIVCYRKPIGERIADVLFAVVLGIAIAAFLFHVLSK